MKRIRIKLFMMIKTIFFSLIFLFFSMAGKGQHNQIKLFPQPQQVQLSPHRFPLKSYRIMGDLIPDAPIMARLDKIFTIADTGKIPLEISTVGEVSNLQQSGAYRLQLSPQKITLHAFDERGVFYAVQTLSQLLNKNNGISTLPQGEIIDFPDVRHRGTVEGFYGVPWTFEDRLAQLHFYGAVKLNTYIYGPKDDPFHSSPNWRLPYPPADAQKIKTLVKTADSNYVDFVWAIHPGKDIQWNLKDSLAVLHKFGLMYDLGVRNFAVFFDDISGVGTDAHKQAGLLNYLQDSFVTVKKDVGPLIMCPTEYNKAWSNKKPGTYLDILGKELDPSIHIMWTGNSVISDINKNGLEWINKRIRRPAYVWWNFPVSDYVRDHLLMGPAYGLDPNAAKEMSGFVSNPMDKSEASKVAIFGVAMYSWNMKAYNPQRAWEAANRYVMPEAPEAFMLFNRNNSDLGPNGHGYRRKESVMIAPVIDSFLNLYQKGSYNVQLANRIQREFDSITRAPEIIKSKSKNKRLIEQIMPWLIQFEWLGKSGSAAMQMVENLHNNNYSVAWTSYLNLKAGLDSMEMVDKKYNQNPYQPGVKTGSLVLTPFVKSLFKLGGVQFLHPGKSLSETPAASLSEYASSRLTNTDKLKTQPLLLTNNSVAYSPVLESITLQPGDYFGIELAKNLKATELFFDFKSGSLKKWGEIEASADGKNWKALEWTEKQGKGKLLINDPVLKYIRFINQGKEKETIFLKEFKLIVTPGKQEGQQVFALDGSINTFETFSKQNELRIELPKNFQKKPLKILVEKDKNDIVVISSINAKGKQKELYRGKSNYIRLNKKRIKKARAIILSLDAEGTGKVYEVMRD